jgi:hypothetical protein
VKSEQLRAEETVAFHFERDKLNHEIRLLNLKLEKYGSSLRHKLEVC